MWVQTSGPPERRVVLFDYTTRAQEVPLRLLAGYRGYLLRPLGCSTPKY
jgi:hypothetical protein